MPFSMMILEKFKQYKVPFLLLSPRDRSIKVEKLREREREREREDFERGV